MFLCAVTRPRGDWDSKIGLWPIVETYVTQRASCNRAAGVEELRSVAISREVSRQLLLEKVIPAIKAKWPQEKKAVLIKLQQDNARTHVDENDPIVLAAFEAMTTDTPNKTFLTLQMVMTQIMNHGGRNDFRLGHMHKDKLTNAGTLPISLPCDSQTLVSAHFDMDRLSALDTPSPPAQPLLVPPLHDEMPPPSPSELDPFLFL
ncbi:hypothetical protein F441_07933 [Phytophthora nicotianae CJ01A1]|uniref:Uncharacterized protein n=2 Tax=Phytophthora nicotianae TaxID=4792 RepID=W2LAP3_PHYNI|nr:hypothetical protein L915_07790 [Phytophthora nicotianae]ETL41266.1 hypothetical protein L916_07720 [Phytophthora nicotianae]ETL94467.1 hypothetical protein L917_07605 [Phytophthora nicotianae]ETP17715.1 hypothetical protein F441_07933 [Phytophthora nicotianae CJ01A1]